MKRILILTIVLAASMAALAQSYGANGLYGISGTPVVLANKTDRNVYGGTIINVTYQGSGFNSTIRNAFQYACKLWEEQIPTTFPLNITVRMAPLIGNNTLAFVTPKTCTFSDGTWLDRPSLKRRAQMHSYLRTSADDFMNTADGEITFNSRARFSYETTSMDCPSDKYDFVTVAIQAIAKVLGFSLRAYYDGTNLVPFNESNVYTYSVLHGNNNYQSIVNSGGALLHGRDQNWLLYSPAVYDVKNALSFFAIDHSNDETLCMQPVLSPGSVIRYIGGAMQDLFYLLDWDRQILTGDVGTSFCSTTPEDALEYVGNSSHYMAPAFNTNLEVEDESYFDDRLEDRGVGSYVLMKDGSWKSFSALSSLGSDSTGLARSSDGYLRLMTVIASYGPGDLGDTYVNYIHQHRLYKFPPQMPSFGVNGYQESEDVLAVSGQRRARSLPLAQDTETYIDVEIGFENTEGCNSILVEQTDSDWPIPYTYYVDPSAGSFTAYMTKQYASSFRLTYINNEGTTVSETKTFDFSNDTDAGGDGFHFFQDGNRLHLNFSDKSFVEDERVHFEYSITDVKQGLVLNKGKMLVSDANIDIATLPSGIYSISVKVGNHNYSRKWSKN